MLRKWGTLVLLLLAAPLGVLAQNTGKLTGVVVDAETGDPLPGANVIVEGTGLGTATNVDGEYTIIGVPVGSYDVRASFVGYQPVTVSDVVIQSGYTRQLDFELGAGAELDEIVVEYEQPLIQNDAIGAPRTVSAEQIQNLPVRGVAGVASLQSGVVSEEGSSTLNIRGGRGEEVSYYVNGVKVIGQVGVPQQAIQEQEMLIGTIPARYGDAMSGVISITTKSGGRQGFFGSVEGITSEVLDPYGYNLGSFSLGGPIIQNHLSFFVAGEYTDMADDNPYGTEILQLDDDMLAALQDQPQVVSLANGDRVRFPAALGGDSTLVNNDTLTFAQVEEALGQALASSPTTGAAAQYLTANDFSSVADKASPTRNLNLTGNFTIQPTDAIQLRVGGGYVTDYDETFSYTRSFYNPGRYYEDEDRTLRGFVNWRHYLSDETFYQVSVDYSDYYRTYSPNGFSSDVEDALFYGDVDGVVYENGEFQETTMAYDVNDLARNYWTLALDGNGYVRAYRDGQLPSGLGVYSLFALPGSGLGTYLKQDRQQFRVSARATTQLGVHQLEFGGEYEQRKERQFYMFATSLARYYQDGSPESGQPEDWVNSYDEFSYETMKSFLVPGDVYGYNYLGTEETDSGDLEALYEFQQTGQLPEGADSSAFNFPAHEPIYYAGYIQDKIEFDDLVINLGARVDVFDNNTPVLKDPFALSPVLRAGALESEVPAGVGSDYAVYYVDGEASGELVGYRDTDGIYYNAEGQRTPYEDIQDLGGAMVDVEGNFNDVFEDYEPQVIFMPRVGVSFPVTNRALFFASYNVLAQRPSEEAYAPPQTYVDIGTSRVPNPKLEPEITTQYELGFRQRLGDRAAIQLSGFYRTQNNKIAVRNMQGATTTYDSYYNVDFTTSKGATLEFDLRRTNNVSVNANYTFQIAEGTGSDASTMATIAWRGNYFPDFVTPASFDQRHTFNATIDYRLGEDEGPMLFGSHILENFGINVLGVLKSGNPYTQLQTPVEFSVTEDLTNQIRGGINEAYMPWTSRLDLRIDRGFELGGAQLSAYLWIQNVLDTENVLGVYRGTGLPTQDGFLSTEAAQQRIANQVDPTSYVFHYNEYLDNPGGSGAASFSGARAYGLPRRTRLGVRLTF